MCGGVQSIDLLEPNLMELSFIFYSYSYSYCYELISIVKYQKWGVFAIEGLPSMRTCMSGGIQNMGLHGTN